MPFSYGSRAEKSQGSTMRRITRPFSDMKRSSKTGGGAARQQRPAPPEVTNAETFYYVKQMNSKTPMVIVMNDGEQLHGYIEWYDRNCLKFNREGAPNLVIQKQWIKYIYKEEE